MPAQVAEQSVEAEPALQVDRDVPSLADLLLQPGQRQSQNPNRVDGPAGGGVPARRQQRVLAEELPRPNAPDGQFAKPLPRLMQHPYAAVQHQVRPDSRGTLLEDGLA